MIALLQILTYSSFIIIFLFHSVLCDLCIWNSMKPNLFQSQQWTSSDRQQMKINVNGSVIHIATYCVCQKCGKSQVKFIHKHQVHQGDF